MKNILLIITLNLIVIVGYSQTDYFPNLETETLHVFDTIDAGGGRITNIARVPIDSLDATSKDYVDSIASLIKIPADSLSLNESIPFLNGALTPFTYYADSLTGEMIFTGENGQIRYVNSTTDIPFLNTTGQILYPKNGLSTGDISFNRVRGLPSVNITSCDNSDLARTFQGVPRDTVGIGEVGILQKLNFNLNLSNHIQSLDQSNGIVAYVGCFDTLTNVRPMPPSYPVVVGYYDFTNNALLVSASPFTGSDTEVNLQGILNGIITQKQGIRTVLDGGVVYFETYNEENPLINLPFMASGNRYFLNTLTSTGTNGSARVALTFGTATSAQTNYVYIDNTTTPTLSVSTTAFPATGIRVCEINLWDLATYNTYPLVIQRFNNAVDGTEADGWVSKSAKRQRLNGSTYESPGIDPTVSIVTSANKDSLKITTTAGIIWQFNRQTFQAQTQKRYLWLNSPTGERWITDLNQANLTEDGIDLHGGNNRRYGLNIFAIQNSGTYDDILAVTTPKNFYTNDVDAVNDVTGYAVTNVPNKYSKVAIRLFRVPVNYSTANNGTITNLLGVGGFQDERGFTLGSGGSGGGSGGATTNFSDADLTIYNSVDPTKVVSFDVSGLTTGTNREFQYPDSSGTIALLSNITTQVTATTPFAVDNSLLRSDGTGRVAHGSNIILSDTDDLTGINDLTATGTISAPLINPTNLTPNTFPVKGVNGFEDGFITGNASYTYINSPLSVNGASIQGAMTIKAATDQVLNIQSAVQTTGAVVINAVNDAGSFNVPMELRSSKFDFWNANLNINAEQPFLNMNPTTSTNGGYIKITNDGGDSYIGRAGSSIGHLVSGGLSYALVAKTAGAYPIQFATNNIARVTIMPTTGNVGFGIIDPRAKIALTEGASSLKSYTTSNGDGLLFNHYYEPSFRRVADIVSNSMTLSRESIIRLITKPVDGEASVAVTLYGDNDAEFEGDINIQTGSTYNINNTNIIQNQIRDGVTTSAPSEDVVYDALALKANLSGANTFDTAPSSAVATSYSQIPTLGQVMDSINNISSVIEIGDTYGGGVVWYLHSSGTWGYCATPSIVEGTPRYWSSTNTTTGASNTILGTGSSNTTTIIADQGAGVYAAKKCDELSFGGYTDWFLPSEDELDSIYVNLHASGLNIYPTTKSYWSSTEINSTTARQQSFATGVIGNAAKTTIDNYYIAVRYFAVTPPTEAPLPVGDAGDILYSVSGGDNTWSGLTIGANGTVLKSNGTMPVYSTDLQGVTSVSGGNGMVFTTITGIGSVAMGIPSQISEGSLNGFPTSSHSHSFDMSTFELDDLGDVPTPIANYYLRRNAANDGYDFVSTAGSSYVLPTASDSEKGGVKTSTTGGTQMIGEFIVQNDSRLNTTTPVPTDLLGYWDVSDGAQRKTTYKALLNALGTPVDLDGTTNTLDLSTYVNGTITVSGNETITFTNMSNGQTGNIEVNQTGTGSLSFTASGYTIKLHPGIYLSAGTTKSVAAGETPTYSYWVVGSVIKINGTQSYQ